MTRALWQRWAIPFAFGALAFTIGAGGIEVARMRLPGDLADAGERVQAAGYGGKNRGRYTLGEVQGEFTRVGSRVAVFSPLYAENRGKSSFTLEGQGLADSAAAECRFDEHVVTIGPLTFDAAKLVYVCEIRDGNGDTLGHLTLGEPKPANGKERALARAVRQGVAEIGDIRIDISSVHEYERSRLSSQAPVGYRLDHETRAVGALELTDSDPTFIFHANATPEVRRATLLAALGLATLRDPATSTLGD